MSIMAPQKYTPELRTTLMEQDTSIRAAIAVPSGGMVVTMGFPGLAFGVAGDHYIDPERMQATLSSSALDPCTLLILLVEDTEVPEDAIALVRAAAEARGIAVAHLPIEDYAAPDARFADRWTDLAPQIAAALSPGSALGVSCHYGAGRSGMIAAGLLVDQGLPVTDAIDTVRAQFPDSIESEQQLNWLTARGHAVRADEGHQ